MGLYQHNPKKFRFTPAQLPQYCRDLPDDQPAPVVDRLVHFYDGSPNVSRQISATLPEPNVQELIMLQAVDDDVELVLDTRQGEKLFPFSDNAHTPDYQEALWSLLVNAADDQGRITMKKLRQYIRDNQETAWNFRNSFISTVNTEYQKLVRTETVKRPFFGGTRICWILSAVAGVLAALVRMFSSLYNGIEVDVSTCVGVTAFVLLALMVFVFCLGRKFGRGRCVLLNQASENDLALCQAFGRYLDDFTNMADKDLPDLSGWRASMVYAVAMGYGSRVADALRLKYPKAASADTFTRDDELYRMLQEQELYRAMASVSRSVADARPPVSDSSGGGSDSGSGGDFIDLPSDRRAETGIPLQDADLSDHSRRPAGC